MRSIVRTIRTLIYAISRLKRKSRLHNLMGKGSLARQLVKNDNTPEPWLSGRPVAQMCYHLTIAADPSHPRLDVTSTGCAATGIEYEFDYCGS